jgi:hypothetical protein
MSEQTVAIAQIRLARRPRRILAVPVAMWIAAAAVGVIAAFTLNGALLAAAIGVALLLVVLGAWLALVTVSTAVRIEVGAVRVHWIGGERVYGLERGSVTRLSLRGGSAARLRTHLRSWLSPIAVGTLRGEERIEMVRQAPSASGILIPTDRGRLLIVPALEQELLNALAASARVQARLEQVVERTRALAARVPAGDEAARSAAVDRAAAEIEPRFLTGIERQILEERLAADRAAAIHSAEAERAAAEAAVAERERAEADLAAAAAQPVEEPSRPRRRWPGRRAAERAVVAVTVPVTAPVAAPEARPTAPPISHRRRRRTTITAPPGTGTLIVLSLAPTIVAAATWVLVVIVGGDHGPQAAGLSAGLLTMGPLGSSGVLMARAWWPRLAPLVALTAILALLLLGWSLVPTPN